MDVVQWLLFGVLPAIAVVLLMVGVGGPRWLGLALSCAVCVPLAMEDGLPSWPWQLDLVRGPPRAALWWLLALGGVFGSAYDLRALPRALALVVELLLVAALPWLLSAPLRRSASFEGGVVYLFVEWLVLAALWWGLRRAAHAQRGLAVPLAMTVALACDAWLMRVTATGADWKLAGVAAVALGLAVVTTTWRRPFECRGGAVLCMTLAHSGLLLCGRNAAGVQHGSFALAWLAPLAFSVALVPRLRRAPRAGALAGVLAVASVGAVAVWAGVPA